MNARSALGDCCQDHPPASAPVAYPYRAERTGATLRAEYRCPCGRTWSCWWDATASGWADGDIKRLNDTGEAAA